MASVEIKSKNKDPVIPDKVIVELDSNNLVLLPLLKEFSRKNIGGISVGFDSSSNRWHCIVWDDKEVDNIQSSYNDDIVDAMINGLIEFKVLQIYGEG